MKFFISVLLIALLSFTTGLFVMLPWWSFTICACVVAIAIPQKPFKSFLSGFVALFLLWGGIAFVIDNKNQHLLSTKVANLLPLNGNYFLLIILTAFIGALVAGLAALSGSYVRKR